MRPQTIKADLPNAYNVKMCLSDEFAMYVKELKATISVGPVPWEHIVLLLTLPKNLPGKVSITVDCWSADTTKAGFVGMTGHWIRVTKEGRWLLEARVLALRALSGDHGGKNLGRYVVGSCDRVGLMGKEQSKVGPYVREHVTQLLIR
jgi:hypothetical protein